MRSIAHGILCALFPKGMHEEALDAARAYLNVIYDDRGVEEALDQGYAEGGYPGAMRACGRGAGSALSQGSLCFLLTLRACISSRGKSPGPRLA